MSIFDDPNQRTADDDFKDLIEYINVTDAMNEDNDEKVICPICGKTFCVHILETYL